MSMPERFRVLPGAAATPVILHVPHASTLIPDDVRRSILLTDDELAAELGHMTDAHTDQLAASAAAIVDGDVPGPPWQFVNGCSRLVVDPERFPDEREEMRSVGMGAVYTRTSHRQALRRPDPQRDAALVQRYYDPYAHALAELVDRRLAAAGRAVIIDLHSYPATALPYELHAEMPRPAICLGTDETHTPAGLVTAAEAAFAGLGEVAQNQPFLGTYVPLRHFRMEPRVWSIMIEIRRDIYCADDGGLDPRAAVVSNALASFTRAATSLALEPNAP